ENRLRTLIGLAQVDTPWTITEPVDEPVTVAPVERLVEEAVNWRPDVRAPLWTMEAARYRLKLSRWGQFNARAVNSIKALGGMPFEESPGIYLFPPIFNQNQGRIARAKAEMEIARRAHETARDRAAQEVRQAYALYTQAKT